MGFRMRKSFKAAKGVRLNVSKSGLGASFGVKGARYSVQSSGRRTASVGIPGSGMSYVSSKTAGSGSRGSSRAATQRQTYTQPPKAPGLFAPAGEKALWQAFVKKGASLSAMDEVASKHPDQRPLALTFTSMQRSSMDGEQDTALKGLQELVDQQFDPQSDPFFSKYLSSSHGSVKIASGVTAELPVSLELLSLTLAELLQAKDKLKEACDVLEALPLSSPTMLSLAELYLQRKEPDKVISLTNGIDNEDDITALASVYRGVALKNKEFYDAALLAFKEALRFSSRTPEIRHLALVQRATLLYKMGKKAQAQKDLERVIADDATFPGAQELLQKYRSN